MNAFSFCQFLVQLITTHSFSMTKSKQQQQHTHTHAYTHTHTHTHSHTQRNKRNKNLTTKCVGREDSTDWNEMKAGGGGGRDPHAFKKKNIARVDFLEVFTPAFGSVWPNLEASPFVPVHSADSHTAVSLMTFHPSVFPNPLWDRKREANGPSDKTKPLNSNEDRTLTSCSCHCPT